MKVTAAEHPMCATSDQPGKNIMLTVFNFHNTAFHRYNILIHTLKKEKKKKVIVNTLP